MKKKYIYFRHQHGFVSIVIILLVGIAIGVSVLITSYYISNSQKMLVVDHAVTNTESQTWAGVEVVRQYLQSLTDDQLATLNNKTLQLDIQNTSGHTLKVFNIIVNKTNNSPSSYHITADIQNSSEKSAASTIIQAVYYTVYSNSNVTTPSKTDSSSYTYTGAMNYYGNVNANGGISIGNGVVNSAVNVAGSFTTASGLTNVKEINALGDVTVGGGGISGLDHIYSNGNVYLLGSGLVPVISAKGTVTTSGGVSVNDIYADGDINIGSNTSINSLNTKSSILVTGSSQITTATAGNKITLLNGKINTPFANSDITYNSWTNLDTAKSGGKFSCISPYWSNYSRVYAVSFYNCTISDKLVKLEPGIKVAEPTGALVTVSLQQKPIVNASLYQKEANYAFSVDEKNQILVYVRNVDGVPEGNYYIGKKYQNYNYSWGYLCKQLDNNHTCIGESVANLAIKKSWPDEIIKYSNGVWTLSDSQNMSNSIASGILYFEGNVNIVTGNYVNTIVSTGDINYGGDMILKAPNYSDAQTVCNSNYFSTPTNLCNSNASLRFKSLANIALLAGSCGDSSSLSLCSAVYNGGNISITSSATIAGNIVAGNKLTTGGATKITGSILSAALGHNTQSILGGSTQILSDQHSHGDDKSSVTLPTSSNSLDTGNSTMRKVYLKWARYL